jgi:hypothetical protein
MSTPAQRRANRLNALQSTGPRSEEGKQRSSRNATTHGVFCKDVMVGGEDAAEFTVMRDGMLRSLNPRDGFELQLVEEIVSCQWRLKRLRSAEVEAYADEAQSLQQEVVGAWTSGDSKDAAPLQVPQPPAGRVMCQLLSDLDNPVLERFSRYEMRIFNLMARSLQKLQQLQRLPIRGIIDDLVGETMQQNDAREMQNEAISGDADPNSGSNRLLYRLNEADRRNPDAPIAAPAPRIEALNDSPPRADVSLPAPAAPIEPPRSAA